MRDKYLVIGCYNCRKYFATRAHLVARCPHCGYQVLLYKNEHKVFGEFNITTSKCFFPLILSNNVFFVILLAVVSSLFIQ